MLDDELTLSRMMGQNKLECLSMIRFFQPSLIFVSKAGADPYSVAVVSLAGKNLAQANALAYSHSV